MATFLFGIAGAWLAIVTGVQLLFREQEKHLRPEFLGRLREWLRDPPRTYTAWVSHFGTIFDVVFGQKHLTWACFWRSCIASSTAIVILTFAWMSRSPEEFRAFASSSELPVMLLAICATTALYSFPCDYLSLLKTRTLIHFLGASPSIFRLVVALLCDLVLTCVVLALGLLYLRFLYTPIFLQWEQADALFHILVSWQGVITTLTLHAFPESRDFWHGPWFSHGVFFYSAFFASMWLWLYGVGAQLMRLLGRMEGLKSVIVKVYDVDAHPLTAIGGVVNVLVTAMFIFATVYGLHAHSTASHQRLHH